MLETLEPVRSPLTWTASARPVVTTHALFALAKLQLNVRLQEPLRHAMMLRMLARSR